MSTHIGSAEIKKLYIGSEKVKQAYLGANRVYINALPVTYRVDLGVTYTEEVEPGQTVLSPTSFTPTKSGYTFVGWREDTVASGTVISSKTMGDTPITLYAVFSQTFTLTKYNGSNTATTANGNRYYNNGNAVNPSFTLSENALSGWSKAGWTTDPSGYAATVADGGTVTIAANATYYSLYTQNITVTYYNNSATASTTSGTRKANVHSTTTYANPSFTLTVASVSGWTARGWSTSNAANGAISYNSGETFTRSSNVTLYASWSANVTVTYYNNSSSASTSTNVMYRGYKGDVTAATFNLTVAAVSGWTVRGWSTSSAANATVTYSSATSFTRTSNCTLYASWSKAVTVSYNGNGQTSGSTANSAGTAYRGYKGDVTNATIILSTNGFARTNYTFYRWASAGGTLYRPGDSISLNENATMAAYWLATTTNFSYTGGVQSFTAKAGVTYLLQVWGAQGEACPLPVTEGSNVPGYGGWAGGYKAFSADAILYIAVGGMGSSNGTGGYNGGGTGAGWANPPSGVETIGRGSGGGGATHIGLSNAVLASTPLSNVLLAAGGGGAVGGTIGWFAGDDYRWGVYVVNGGNGGGVNGNDAASGGSAGGTGGTQTTGGTNTTGVGYGSYGTGGTAPEVHRHSFSGGGAGLYGGGAGYHSGAGGGSGYVGGVASGSMQNGVRTGHGYASITIASVA